MELLTPLPPLANCYAPRGVYQDKYGIECHTYFEFELCFISKVYSPGVFERNTEGCMSVRVCIATIKGVGASVIDE